MCEKSLKDANLKVSGFQGFQVLELSGKECFCAVDKK